MILAPRCIFFPSSILGLVSATPKTKLDNFDGLGYGYSTLYTRNISQLPSSLPTPSSSNLARAYYCIQVPLEALFGPPRRTLDIGTLPYSLPQYGTLARRRIAPSSYQQTAIGTVTFRRLALSQNDSCILRVYHLRIALLGSLTPRRYEVIPYFFTSTLFVLPSANL